MSGGHRLIRCQPTELFDALAHCCEGWPRSGRLRKLAGLTRMDWEPPRRARLGRRTALGTIELELTVHPGAYGCLTSLEIRRAPGPSAYLPATLRAAYLTLGAERLLARLDDVVRSDGRALGGLRRPPGVRS